MKEAEAKVKCFCGNKLDYRGEVGFIGESQNGNIVRIEKGQRIAQLIIKKNEDVDLVEVDELSDTERGDGGFGSTGKN